VAITAEAALMTRDDLFCNHVISDIDTMELSSAFPQSDDVPGELMAWNNRRLTIAS
jgi:hypothetical protein